MRLATSEPRESLTTLARTQFLRLRAKPCNPKVPATVHPLSTRHIKIVRGPNVDSSPTACLCDGPPRTSPSPPAVGTHHVVRYAVQELRATYHYPTGTGVAYKRVPWKIVYYPYSQRRSLTRCSVVL
ncbi:hypothetical protein E2C01_059222 [Portunus trituberculatus]|uniref:Uncharacterized protein n=1 Tax=Portunus trituberculatus TaxID=210409 RepID=A0A5B7H594_PORTR|nr:hypothetical protein [Portunus trituberculatus]